jgi:hypothetical protein
VDVVVSSAVEASEVVVVGSVVVVVASLDVVDA